jgi:hypothetical protein
MFTEQYIDFLSVIMRSLIRRTPFFLELDHRALGQELQHIMSFIPAHRFLVVTGNAPKWTRFLEGQPRRIETDDLDDLASALQSTFEEESMGRRPTQVIAFEASPDLYEAVLSPLPKGWVATTEDLDSVRKRFPSGTRSFVHRGHGGLKACHLGDEPLDLEFERSFLGKLAGRPKSVATFLVQKKFAEMHLAGAAILRMLEQNSGSMTITEVEELFELEGATAEQMLELMFAEHGINLRTYLRFATPQVIEAVERLSGLDHVIAVAAVEDEKVIALKALRSTEIKVSALALQVGSMYGQVSSGLLGSSPDYMYLGSSEGQHVVLLGNGRVRYVVLLAKEGRVGIMIPTIMDALQAGN